MKKVVDKRKTTWYNIEVVASEWPTKKNKKVVDKHKTVWYNIKAVSRGVAKHTKKFEKLVKNVKKLLTNETECDIINKLSQESEQDLEN